MTSNRYFFAAIQAGVLIFCLNEGILLAKTPNTANEAGARAASPSSVERNTGERLSAERSGNALPGERGYSSPGESGATDSAADSLAAPGNGSQNANNQVVKRQGKELYRAVYATLKKWALAKEELDCQQAAVELLYVYEELFGDTQLPEDTQSTLRTLVRCRLKSLSQTLSVYNKKRADSERKAAILQARAAKQPKNLKVPDGKTVAEGQVFAAAQMGGNADNDNWFGTGSSNNNADCGEDLVELIQNTVRRPTWQANGGNASMYYYRQLRALVVSQTQEGHEEIERLLEALRRAGS